MNGPSAVSNLAGWPGIAGMLVLAAVAAAEPLTWKSLPPIPNRLGLAGPFAGTSGGGRQETPEVLVVGGGANFPDGPLWDGGTKQWHRRVFVLPAADAAWIDAGTLPRPLAYGVSASHGGRLWCVGGCDAEKHVPSTVALRWDAEASRLEIEHDALPPLPMPLAYATGATIGSRLYIAGGQTAPDATRAVGSMWSIDLAAPRHARAWREHPSWPGPARIHAVSGVLRGRLYLVGGVELLPPDDESDSREPGRRFLADAFEFDPTADSWKQLASPSTAFPAAAGPAIPLDGDDGSRLLFLPGNDWELFSSSARLRNRHPGFPRQLRIYDAAADSWRDAGSLPEPYLPVVTTTTVRWRGGVVVPSGEIRPCFRSPQVFEFAPAQR